MGAFKQVGENVTEDFIDDGVSNLVYAMGNCMFNDNKNSKKDCNNVVDIALKEAIEGASSTLKFSIMNAVIMKVSTYAMSKLVAGGGMMYLWIKKRRILNNAKNVAQSAVSWIPFVGKSGAKAVDSMMTLLNGNQAENLKMVGMANDSLNNVTAIIGQERQTAVMQKSYQRDQVMKTLKLNHNAKGLSDKKSIEAYHYKMKTGTWKSTTTDKKLFLSVVPKMYIKPSFVFNSVFVNELNQFKEYAISTEKKLVNLAQTQLDMNTNSMMNKL